MFKDFIQRYHNAKKVVAQINAGLWKPETNSIAGKHYTAIGPNNAELWITGPFYITIYRSNPCPFGLFWRHYVWWFAARKLKNDADNSTKRKIPIL